MRTMHLAECVGGVIVFRIEEERCSPGIEQLHYDISINGVRAWLVFMLRCESHVVFQLSHHAHVWCCRKDLLHTFGWCAACAQHDTGSYGIGSWPSARAIAFEIVFGVAPFPSGAVVSTAAPLSSIAYFLSTRCAELVKAE